MSSYLTSTASLQEAIWEAEFQAEERYLLQQQAKMRLKQQAAGKLPARPTLHSLQMF